MSDNRKGILSKGRVLDDWRDYHRMRQTGEAGTRTEPIRTSPGSGDLGDSYTPKKDSPGVVTETGGVDKGRKAKAKPTPSEPKKAPDKVHREKGLDRAATSEPRNVERTDDPKKDFLKVLLKMLSMNNTQEEGNNSLKESERLTTSDLPDDDKRSGKRQARIGGKFFDRFF